MTHAATIFVNLPVGSLAGSKPFYAALGMKLQPLFSSEDTACMVLSPHIHVMLMEHGRFQSFMPPNKALVSGRQGTECLFCISVGTRSDVDEVVEACEKNGGKKDPTILPQMGSGYVRSVEDPDGHVWEVVFLGDMRTGEGECEGI